MSFVLNSCCFNSFFINHVEIESARLKLALIIRTGAPITVANDATEMLSVVTDITINDLSNNLKKQYIY